MIKLYKQERGNYWLFCREKKLQLCEKEKKKKICGYVNHNLYKGDNVRELQ